MSSCVTGCKEVAGNDLSRPQDTVQELSLILTSPSPTVASTKIQIREVQGPALSVHMGDELSLPPKHTEHSQAQKTSLPPTEQLHNRKSIDPLITHMAAEPTLGSSGFMPMPTMNGQTNPPRMPNIDGMKDWSGQLGRSVDGTHRVILIHAPQTKSEGRIRALIKSVLQSLSKKTSFPRETSIPSSDVNDQDLRRRQFIGMIEAGRWSTQGTHHGESEDSEDGSQDSEDGNGFQTTVLVQDLKGGKPWEFRALIDTQSPKTFVSRGMLDKIGHGQFRERPFPPGKAKTYTVPFGKHETRPGKFIDAIVEVLGTALKVKKIPIMENAEDFEMIIGRDLIKTFKQKTNTSLPARVEESSDGSATLADGAVMISALRSVSKTKKQKIEDEQHRLKVEKDRENLLRMSSSGSVPSKMSMPVETARYSTRSNAAHEGNNDYRLPFSHQHSYGDQERDFAAGWRGRSTIRTGTWSTQDSVDTVDSVFSIQSTTSSTSSTSSWNGPTALAEKPSQPALAQTTAWEEELLPQCSN